MIKSIQIDIIPLKGEPTIFKMHQYLLGNCYTSTITKTEVERLIKHGVTIHFKILSK